MGMVMERSIGTGRAKCQICDERIMPGQRCIKAFSIRSSGQCHAVEEDCIRFNNDDDRRVYQLAYDAKKVK
jgi:hypothetical protein